MLYTFQCGLPDGYRQAENKIGNGQGDEKDVGAVCRDVIAGQDDDVEVVADNTQQSEHVDQHAVAEQVKVVRHLSVAVVVCFRWWGGDVGKVDEGNGWRHV